ncbi:MAG: carbohydrate kinase family protein [Anaerolineae bacterium]
MDAPQVVVVGAAGMDTKGRARGPLVPATSNPGDIRISVGGVGRNIAENLARLGVNTFLLSVVGDDDSGWSILECTRAGGVNVEHVLVQAKSRSAAYLAVLDEEGRLAISVDDMEIVKSITSQYIYQRRRLIRDSDMVVMDANLLTSTIRSLLKVARRYRVPVCADPTSTSLAVRLRDHLPELYMVTPNVAEAEVLCEMSISNRDEALQAAKKLVAMGVEVAIVTLAEMGVCYATTEVSGHVPAIRGEIVDLTGAGDAMTAGIVFGLLNEFPVDEAVRLGVSAASLTLSCRETVCPDLNLEKLYDQLVI